MFLSLFSVGIILIAIFIGVNLTKKSYALFSDSVTSVNTIEVEIEIPIEREPINISQDTVIDLSTSQFPINADISLNGYFLTLTDSGNYPLNPLNDIIVNSGTL